MLKSLTIKNQSYRLPIFLPDATRAVVRSLRSEDIASSGIEGVVVNTYHLLSDPGVGVLSKASGVKNFMNYSGLVVSDSGGWQIFSLIHRNRTAGKITDDGVIFSIGGAKKQLITPEDVIRHQFAIGSDIMICLDDFTDPAATPARTKESVERTLLWAQRCKDEFQKQLLERGLTDATRPHLYAPIQGGSDRAMRKYCAEELLATGFDGYGFGGYLIDEKGGLDIDMLKYMAELVKDGSALFALGTGTPYDIAQCASIGWDIFDCTLPTRDARHQRLYVFEREPLHAEDLLDKEIHSYLYIGRSIFKDDFSPISEFCECSTCKNYSRAYLHHLFKVNDTSAYTLASVHNLHIYSKVIQLLRSSRI